MERIPQEVLDSIGFIEIQSVIDLENRYTRAKIDSLKLKNGLLTAQLSGFQKYVKGEGWKRRVGNLELVVTHYKGSTTVMQRESEKRCEHEKTRELMLQLPPQDWAIIVNGPGGSPKVMILFPFEGTNYFLFHRSDMEAFNMIGEKN